MKINVKKRPYALDDQSLDIYLQEIGETELLNSKEEVALAQSIREGDERALEGLVQANLRFVVSVAKQYQNQGLSLSDLISEGNIGLMKAARRFDETKGFKFISYAVWWIRQAILHALAEQSRLIRLPVNKVEELRKIERTLKQREIQGRQGNETDKMIDPPEIPEWANKPLSLDAPIGDQGAFSLMDRMKDHNNTLPDEAFLDNALRDEITQAVASLAPRESEVLNLYFGLSSDRSYTLEEIGHRFGLTRERIRQIKQKAINKLRHSTRGRRLATFAD
ncbi:MAG TPA: sigma-70 family RNA polymerase sigma factor [candidate division Zixibacteria bacterium]|jgi:RNA polymerase primary sigma factor|nr:sigma-70 family RNA polymerase sigma factor [candidate division Zixibacteria bacterium]